MISIQISKYTLLKCSNFACVCFFGFWSILGDCSHLIDADFDCALFMLCLLRLQKVDTSTDIFGCVSVLPNELLYEFRFAHRMKCSFFN